MSDRAIPRIPGSVGKIAVAGVFAMACVLGLLASARAGDDSAQKSDASQKVAEGKKLFHERCGYCHLQGGTGTIMLARRLGKDRSLLEERTDLSAEYIKKITRVGINGMPPHNRIELPDSELDLIAIYLTRPASERTPSGATTKGGAQ